MPGRNQAQLAEVLAAAPFMGNVAEAAVPGRGDEVLFSAVGAQGQFVHLLGRLVFIPVNEDDCDPKTSFGSRYSTRDIAVFSVRLPEYGIYGREPSRTQGLCCLLQAC